MRESFHQDGQWCPYAGCEPEYLGDSFWSGTSRVIYAADAPDMLPPPITGNIWRSRPSIHMPRSASRITLEITAVRVERLQDISRDDAESEGFKLPPVEGQGFAIGARTNFRHGWDHINGPGSWDANPWVWVVEFKPYMLNVDALAQRGEA